MGNVPVVGILLGDAAGVGGELVAKILAEGFHENKIIPLVIGDFCVLERSFNIIGKKVDVTIIKNYDEIKNNNEIYFLDINSLSLEEATFGENSVACGASVLKQLDMGCKLYEEKIINGFVFAPLNKASMIMAGSEHQSEHEYLASKFNISNTFGEINKVNDLWTVRVTSHVPISEVSKNITKDSVKETINLAYNTMKKAGIKNPRIGVSALNPHCGESGKCGREEIEIIQPVVQGFKDEKLTIEGPISADVLFVKAFNKEFDCIVTMYHDQGQIALKLQNFDSGVTIAGGLAAPIATCAHGTAFDIAGKNIVRDNAFKEAIKVVASMC